MDLAKDKEESDWDLTLHVLTINYAAIHTSSITLTHTFFYLAAYPEHLKALREEVEDVVRKYDFIKESQRLDSLPIDHVFSDGTMVPKDTTIGVATPRAHLNGDRYEDPLQFDGFCYVTLKEYVRARKAHLPRTVLL
ncbi:hypothetical protein NLJ89_g9013 [Agrocybe chaxingu]|uniref:Cytochrome P450 n=1 Tax=Agrocybe chaxingu TaxID=84603 RepID=A0A9W8K0S7_9AGAR|nr:hypothetical protein NLJ89_g9013 [Agrocybe chaxingu]